MQWCTFAGKGAHTQSGCLQIKRGETEAACATQQGSADRAKRQLLELQQSEQALQQQVNEEMAGLRQLQRELADSRQTLKDYEAAHDR